MRQALGHWLRRMASVETGERHGSRAAGMTPDPPCPHAVGWMPVDDAQAARVLEALAGADGETASPGMPSIEPGGRKNTTLAVLLCVGILAAAAAARFFGFPPHPGSVDASLPRPGTTDHAAFARNRDAGQTQTQERPMKTLIAVTAGAMVAGQAQAGTIRVPQDFPTIQAAIDAALAGDEVQVSAGTYVEQVNLRGKEIRLVAPAGAASTIIDGNGAWTPLLGSGEPAGCLVQGFTIRNGYADGLWSGAGVEVAGSSLTIKDCVIRDNRAVGYGWWASAGLRSQGGAVVVEGCRFTNNDIAPTENIHGSSALFHYAGGSITLRDCEFVGNITTRNNRGSYPEQSSRQVKVHAEFQQTTAVIERCVFSQQRSEGPLPIFQLELEGNFPQLSLTVSNCAFASGGTGTSSVIWTDSATTITDSVGCGFASVTAPWMTSGISISSCEFVPICTDCDGNGTADVVDIRTGHHPDSNANGVPDVCEVPACSVADLTSNGVVDGADLGALLAFWGPVNPVFPQADVDGDGNVNGADLGMLLSFWGPCGG